jgi:hypothetical protein
MRKSVFLLFTVLFALALSAQSFAAKGGNPASDNGKGKPKTEQPTLSSLSISGLSSMDENTSATFTAIATWSDGSTSVAAPTWSENSAYTTISSGGVLTASAVTANQTVTVTASYTSGGITKTATKSVSIVDIPLAAPTLSSLAISGPTSLDESTSATFSAIATWSDGSTSAASPSWSENSAYATINSNGVLTVSEVMADQTVTLTASFTKDGITKTASKSVSIVDTTPAAPTLSGLSISGPSSMDENTSVTFSAIATWSDGSTSAAAPTWSENSAYATISSSGVLTASEVTADQTVAVSASYTSDGITQTATKSVSIADIPVSSGATTAVFGDVPGANYPNTVTDTFININTANSLTNTSLNTYTWPTDTPANAILMKWDISALPAGAQILDAKLYLYMNQVSGTGGDSLYDLSVHKIINKNPDLTKTTGYTYDGANSWTSNSLAYNGVPLAQKDIAPAADVQSIDKTFGYKSWNVTQITKDWKANLNSNYGFLLNSDVTASSDSNRSFASSEAADGSQRPKLVITYTLDPNYTPPPLTLSSLAISGPSSLYENTSSTFSATAIWSDGSTSSVTPTWSENSAYATISSGGVLTASEITADEAVTVSASYTSNGVNKTATKSVSINDQGAFLPPQVTLAWDPSSDPQAIGHRLYYKESSDGDPSYNTLPFNSPGSPIDVGLNETFTMNLPYDKTVFCFTVTAYNADGLESDSSNVVCIGN